MLGKGVVPVRDNSWYALSFNEARAVCSGKGGFGFAVSTRDALVLQ